MEKDNILSIKRLASNDSYYNSVFKKTEKIVSVIFYILSYIDNEKQSDFYIDTIKEKSMRLMEETLNSLSFYEYEAKDKLFTLQQSLLALEGALRIANSSRLLTDEVFSLLLGEIDLVQRYIRNHFSGEAPVTIQEAQSTSPKPSAERSGTRPTTRTASAPTRVSRAHIPEGDISSDAHLVYSQLVDRAVRIKTVLEAKPEATIKDIAEVITDVSEKTIQRELNSLIEKGEVIRQGKRRWSKYSLAK